jgi:hypothetical protein
MSSKNGIIYLTAVVLLGVGPQAIAQANTDSIAVVNRNAPKRPGSGGRNHDRSRPERPNPPVNHNRDHNRDHDRDRDRDRSRTERPHYPDHRYPRYPHFPRYYPPSYYPTFPSPIYPDYGRTYVLFGSVYGVFYGTSILDLDNIMNIGAYSGYRVRSITVNCEDLSDGSSYSTIIPIVNGRSEGIIYPSDYQRDHTIYLSSGYVLGTYGSMLLQIRGDVEINTITVTLER